MKNLQRFYPILFGVYSALGLISSNIDQMRFADGVRSILLAFLSRYWSTWFFTGASGTRKASLLSAFFLLLFFAYGHVYDALEGFQFAGVTLGRHRFLFPVWVLVFTVLGIWIYKQHWKLAATGRFLFVMSIILLVMPIAQIGIYEWGRYRSVDPQGNGQSQANQQQNLSPSTENLPDIYYIILDGYPRQDALIQNFDFDNQFFIDQLEELGFSVPTCSQSNYAMTILSLSTSLNMNYADAFGDVGQVNFEEKIANSETQQILQEFGYQTVALESSIWFTDFREFRPLHQSKTACAEFFF